MGINELLKRNLRSKREVSGNYEVGRYSFTRTASELLGWSLVFTRLGPQNSEVFSKELRGSSFRFY